MPAGTRRTAAKTRDAERRGELVFERPLVLVDVVVFVVRADRLEVLLVRRPTDPGDPYPGRFALPGGFVDIDRDADLAACAARKLRDKTGIDPPYLEQVGSVGGRARDPRGWSVTSVYFALLSAQAVSGSLSDDAAWVPVDGDGVSRPLAFDHADLLAMAVRRLRAKVEYTSLPAFLLPDEFTLSDLQRVYEIVLGRALEKSAFRTRILSAGLVETVPKRREGVSRPAQLYRLSHPNALVYFPRTFNPPRN